MAERLELLKNEVKMLLKTIRPPLYLICLLSAVISIGCGYRLIRSFSSWPQNIRNVYVKTIENQTKEPGLEAIVTDALIQEFWRWNKVKVVNRPEAQAILSGTITKYSADQPLSFDRERNIREYELSIHVDIQLEEVSTGKILWQYKDEVIKGSFPYFEYDLAETRAEEKQAKIRAAGAFAKKLLDKSFSGF